MITCCKEGVEVLTAPAIAVPHGFSTRAGGVSTGIFESLNLGHRRGDDPAHVRENYRRFCAATGTGVDHLVMSNQVHGNTVRVVTAADAKPDLLAPTPFEADGLATNTPGLTLCVFSADCIPILLYDPVEQAVAAIHAGWRGTASAIAKVAVETMTARFGSDPAAIRAAIGPGIGKCCFQTDDDVPAAMTERLGALSRPFLSAPAHGETKWRVDLKGLNKAVLESAGVLPGHIEVSMDCTCCRHDRYWSHRYTRGERGSQAAVIMLPQRALR